MDEILEKAIIKNLPIVVFVVDKDFRLKFSNSRFREMFKCEQKNSSEFGLMIGCETLRDGGNCTQELSCGMCTLRTAVKECLKLGNDVYHKIIEKNVVINGKSKTISLKLSMRKLDEEEDFICIVDDVSQIIEINEREIRKAKDLFCDISKAKKIQRHLLPKKSDFENIDFSYIYRQLSIIGGDFFSVYQIDENNIGFYIADVSGHGVSGGMLTVFLNDNFNTKTLSPAQALNDLNIKFNKYKFSEDSYITVLSAIVNTKLNTITYSNAGHSEPILLYTRGQVFELTEKGSPISNWFANPVYKDNTFKCNTGDRLMLFTDGVGDMINDEDENYSTESFKKHIQEKSSINQIVKKLDKEIKEFTSTPKDDVTVIMLEIK